MTLDEMYRDLDEADRLGDTELANTIADRIRATQRQPVALEVPSVPAPWAPIPEPSRLPELSTSENVAKSIDDLVRSMASGATFGAADELAAAAGSGMAVLGGAEFGPEYERRLASERSRDETIPLGIRIPGEIAGGVAGIMAAAPFLPFRAATGGLGRTAQVLGGGAGGGAAAGFGHGEGGFLPRLQGAAEGAGIGALGAGAFNLAAPIGRGIRNLFLPSSAARDRLGATLRQSGMTSQEARSQLDELGPDGLIADISDATRQQTQTALSKAPAQLGRAAEVLEGRVGGAPSRITGYISQLAGGRNFRATIDDMTKAQREAAKPLYDAAEAAVPVFRSPEVAQAVRQPILRGAVEEARKAVGLKKIPKGYELPYDFVDRVYKYVGDAANKSTIRGARFKAGDINNARVALRDAIVRENPDYGKALEAFAGPAQLKRTADLGRKFWNQDADDVSAAIRGLTSQSEKDAYLLGVSKAIQDQIGKGVYGSDMSRRLAGTPAKRELLRTVFPSQGQFDDFMNKLLAEGEFARTRNVVLGGSPTQPRLAAAEELGSLAETAATGNVLPWMTRASRRLLSGEMSPRQSRELVNMMLMGGPEAQGVLRGSQPVLSARIGLGSGLAGGLSALPGGR